MPVVNETSRLAVLRQRTRAAHASMERVPAMARLMAPDLNRAEYISILQHMHAFLAAIEPAMAAGLELYPAAAAMLDGDRPRALAADLAWFGAPAILTPPPLPAVETVAAALGALYVVEGSNLGGRVIARHVSDSLGVRPASGGSFYGGQSAEAARARWAALCVLLEVQSETLGDTADTAAETMAASACETFQCLEWWMRRIDVAPGCPSLATAVGN
jgi:heme oxygenase